VATIDISGVIGAYLKRPGFRLIGIADYEGLHRSIEPAAKLRRNLPKLKWSAFPLPTR